MTKDDQRYTNKNQSKVLAHGHQQAQQPSIPIVSHQFPRFLNQKNLNAKTQGVAKIRGRWSLLMSSPTSHEVLARSGLASGADFRGRGRERGRKGI